MKLIDYIKDGDNKIFVSVLYNENVYYFQVYSLSVENILDGLWGEYQRQSIKLQKIAELNKELEGKDITL